MNVIRDGTGFALCSPSVRALGAVEMPLGSWVCCRPRELVWLCVFEGR